MKTYKIIYNFFDIKSEQFGLGCCLLEAASLDLAEDSFKLQCDNYSDIISIEAFNKAVFIKTFGGFLNV